VLLYNINNFAALSFSWHWTDWSHQFCRAQWIH